MHKQSSGRSAAPSTVSVGLWIAQALLATLFIFAGGMKLVMPLDAMASLGVPGVFLRFIGMCELLGGLGLILPGILHIRPQLTPLAAAGLAIIMLGAVLYTPPEAIVLALIPATLGVLAVAVAYGRWRLAPHQPAAPRQSLAFGSR